ncbi:MAG: hypothetical protein ACLFPE_05850 [Bacteroidales bacterium]
MMKRALWSLMLMFGLSVTTVFGQDDEGFDPGEFTVGGYFQFLENVWLQPNTEKLSTMGTLNNRLDVNWNKGSFSAQLGTRNILNYGGMVHDFYPYLTNLATQDYGYFDLTEKWAGDSSYFFYTNVDRAHLSFTHKNLEITAGRQRINWGTNLVWNPNDIFNTFNYFDFDYAERPGCDALRVQYYTGMTSSAQVAWKVDSDDKHTIAGMYRFNKWSYDFQFLGGVMGGDMVLGAGWSGQIEGAGFNGEITWFHPYENFSDHKSTVVGSAGANYTFSNSLYIHASAIYNSDGTTGKAFLGNFVTGNRDISAKTLTPARMELFAEAAYQISPLIRGNVAGIVNPYDGSAFAGPSVDISLTQNLGLLLLGQLFFGETRTEYGDYGQLLYARLKWNF